jgi:hypothetical protein
MARTNGIPSRTNPGRWLVPPWPTGASVCTVVEHFLRFRPHIDTSTADRVAYYEGYAAALDDASTHELTDSCSWRWYQDLRDSIARCVTSSAGQP